MDELANENGSIKSCVDIVKQNDYTLFTNNTVCLYILCGACMSVSGVRDDA